MQEYHVVDVGERELESAFFVARAVAPELTLEDWLAQSKPDSEDAGMLGLRGPDGTLLGFLRFRTRSMSRLGPTLTIEKLVTLDLVRAGRGRRLLLEAARRRAETLGCVAIARRSATAARPAADR